MARFDTAFPRTAPEVEQAFALPYAFYQEGGGATASTGLPSAPSLRDTQHPTAPVQ